ncbi:5-oxoprolinase subunit PxpB [Microvirga rosea]|uniref:5-oxoprolinase subunit PxpB n=1 Tax=Microvirga rosea TaxID=2715425 RepID=UPI0038730971
MQEPRILPCGDTALSIEFGSSIDADLNDKVLALDASLRASPPVGLRETVPTYRSLLVHFDPTLVDYDVLTRALLDAAKHLHPEASTGRRWKVPVFYGGSYGMDLEEVSERHGLSPEAVISLHCEPIYRIYMIGFMPGFAYLGGLDARLATPRRTQPRAHIPSGSIIIGGAQAAVSSIECPSGWHILGRTPVRSYAPEREPAFLFAAGDEIVFDPKDPALWKEMEQAALAGEPVAELVAP